MQYLQDKLKEYTGVDAKQYLSDTVNEMTYRPRMVARQLYDYATNRIMEEPYRMDSSIFDPIKTPIKAIHKIIKAKPDVDVHMLGEFDNEAYIKQPYNAAKTIEAINKGRGSWFNDLDHVRPEGYVGRIPGLPDNADSASAYTGIIDTETGKPFGFILDTKDKVYSGNQTMLDRFIAGRVKDPDFIRLSATERRNVIVNDLIYNGFFGDYSKNPLHSFTHEANHVNNAVSSYKKTKEALFGSSLGGYGFSDNTYASRPMEAIQALASFKRSIAANNNGFELDNEEKLSQALHALDTAKFNSKQEALANIDGETIKLRNLPEVHRLKTYLQTSKADYVPKADASWYVPLNYLMPWRLKSAPKQGEMHPVMKEIGSDYGDIIDDIV